MKTIGRYVLAVGLFVGLLAVLPVLPIVAAIYGVARSHE